MLDVITVINNGTIKITSFSISEGLDHDTPYEEYNWTKEKNFLNILWL